MTFFSTLKFTMATAVIFGASSAFADEVRLRLAGQHPIDHNATRVLMETIERIESADVGIEIQLFPAGQLGNGEVVFEDTAAGVIDIGHTFIYSHNDPILEINSLPYLVSNYAEMEQVYSQGSAFYEIYEERIAAQGLRLLGVYAEGFIGVGSTSAPEDAGGVGDKNLNIRVWSAEVGRLTAQAMGFNTTTMNWGDVVPAIQQGVIEGVIGGTAESNYTVFGDAVSYFTPYNAFVENTAFYINQNTWDGLSEAQQTVLSEAFADASAASFELSETVDREYLGRLGEVGVELVEISPEELSSIAGHVRETVWPVLEENLGSEILQAIMSDLN
ncbi:TRAP transporter substrate-binding protein DctP [Cochlodiniinecator piscidefendens]|uniref:TRAP transporter substrate-binding protein DctP n=1 Tax=Cochlodiniinecator piscidefendens TaxID=2715756 RepID=UPI00140CBD88|nr:TRAP transporter substrate-binding protein DctP [Cochlodiniinecator piscidefendens]